MHNGKEFIYLMVKVILITKRRILNISIPVSKAVIAYARIVMSKYKHMAAPKVRRAKIQHAPRFIIQILLYFSL